MTPREVLRIETLEKELAEVKKKQAEGGGGCFALLLALVVCVGVYTWEMRWEWGKTDAKPFWVYERMTFEEWKEKHQ